MKTISCFVVTGILGACGGGGDGGGDPDAAPLVREDRDYVITRLILPASDQDVADAAFRFPGESADANSLGSAILAQLTLLEGIPVQADLDAGMEAGASLQVVRVHSTAPSEDDPAAVLSFGDLEDAGAGQYRVAGSLAPYAEGTLDGGQLDGASDETSLTIGMPIILGEPATRIALSHPRIRVTMTEDGLTGVFGAAMTPEVLHGDVFPDIAALMTRAIAENTVNADTIRSLFDGDADGTITTQELIDSPTLAQVTRPDLDLDGDTLGDHLSVGMAFEATRAELVP